MANQKLIIKQLCKEKGVTTEQLAKKLGIKRTSFSQAMTRNNFNMERLSIIADELKVTIPELFEDANTITCPYCKRKIHIKFD